MNKLFALLLLSNAIFAQDIVINGLNRTKKKVILRELNLKSDKEISKQQLLLGIERIKSTNLFSKIEYKYTKNKITIDLEEKWTTIPIVKLNNGGGVTQTTLGVYDPNIFGHYIESGAQYERLEDTNSGVVWFKNPRLFNKRQGIDIQLWNINRLRTKYKQEVEGRIVKEGFLHKRKKLYLGYTKEYSNKLSSKVFYELNDDSFTDRLVPEEAKGLNFTLPPNSKYHFIGIGLDYGQIKSNIHLLDGLKVSGQIRSAFSDTKNLKDFYDFDLSVKYFKTIGNNLTFSQRFMNAMTSTKVLQYWWYLGGLDRIRGFSDNRFAGRYYLLSNSEIRYAFKERSNYILQAVTFLDLASVSEKYSDLAEIDGASMGLGLRIYLPKIYRFVARIDYAKPIKSKDDNEISFGVQQFF